MAGECLDFDWNRWSMASLTAWLESAASLIGLITLEVKLTVKA